MMKDKENYTRCVSCLMDTTAAEITFNKQGVCSFCTESEIALKDLAARQLEKPDEWEKQVEEIKSQRGSNKYDCILGLSGGVDSSYLALLCKRHGLKPLCVHFDNGWNSEIAVSNIKKIVEQCGFDLETYVINWKEFKDLQRAFIRAGVVDIEMLTDHAIFATMIKIQRKSKVKFVLSGINIATEHGMPDSWVWGKLDAKNIKAIHKSFGEVKTKSFPFISIWKVGVINRFKLGSKVVDPLNMIPYNKKSAIIELQEEFGWEDYGGKHFESVFTKFYQAYILPKKFNIDKRKVHLSALIRTGEISLEQGEEILEQLLYDEHALRRDKAYVLKKLGFDEKEFDEIMAKPRVEHDFYPSSLALFKKVRKWL